MDKLGGMVIRVKPDIKKIFLLNREPIDKVIKKAHIAEDFMSDQFNKKTFKIVS